MKKMVKGEITVFLSLVFLLLLTLVGALLESASIQLAKNERRADAGRAVESAFAEYQKDLLERYGIFAGLGCGIVFLMISKWSQEGIGYGDSWMILNMGIFLGIWNLLGMLMLAFLVAAMAAGAGLWSGKWKRTTRMSFYPFLLIGYLGTFIW